ncbi:hypothetical protein ACFSTD_02025 [Novosphingobium colocasiae]
MPTLPLDKAMLDDVVLSFGNAEDIGDILPVIASYPGRRQSRKIFFASLRAQGQHETLVAL